MIPDVAGRAVPPKPPGGPLAARLSAPSLRSALWAVRALRRARRDLRRKGITATVALPPTGLDWEARRGVYSVLARWPNTCLERALVLQRWLHAQGFEHEVVIGITRLHGEIKAHAWLDFEPAAGQAFEELYRLAP